MAPRPLPSPCMPISAPKCPITSNCPLIVYVVIGRGGRGVAFTFPVWDSSSGNTCSALQYWFVYNTIRCIYNVPGIIDLPSITCLSLTYLALPGPSVNAKQVPWCNNWTTTHNNTIILTNMNSEEEMFQVLVTTILHVLRDLILQSMQTCSAQLQFLHKNILICIFGGPFIYYMILGGMSQ